VLTSKKYADIIIPNYGRELMEELVLITEKLSTESDNKSRDQGEFVELSEKFQQCDNMAINLIVEFINNKLKKSKIKHLDNIKI